MDAFQRSILIAEVRAYLHALVEAHGVNPLDGQDTRLEDLADDVLADVAGRLRDMLRTLGGVRQR